MIRFQILLVAVLGVLLVATIIGAVGRRLPRVIAAGLCLLWLAGLVAAIRPTAMTRLAHLAGIGRGADLVLYCAVLLMFAGFFMVYVRIRRLHGDITRLVREIALLRAEGPLPGGEDDRGPQSAGGPGDAPRPGGR